MSLFESLLLIASAILLLFIPDSSFVFQVAIFVGTAITLNMFLRMMRDSNWIRFGNIACFSILFGYVVSTAAYTVINLLKYGVVDYTVSIVGFGYSQAILSDSVLAIFIVCVVLSVIAHFERPLSISAYFQRSLSSQSILLIVLSAVVIAVGFLKESIGYGGIYFVSEKRISPLGALCFIAIPPLTAISFASLLFLPVALQKYRKALIATSAFLILITLPLGRRVLMYTILLSMILVGPKIFEMIRSGRIRTMKVVCLALAAALFFGWGFQTFFAVRMTINKIGFQERPGLLEIIPLTIDLFRDSYARVELNEKLIENVSERPFILPYLAGLMDAHADKSTQTFGELGHALKMAVPSLLVPEKTRNLASAPEDFSHVLLGLPVFDGPNTILTAGLNDLGFIGLLIYPVAVVAFYVFIYRLIPPNWSPLLTLFILLRLMYSILYVEESLGGLVGSGLRDLVIVAFIYWIILKVSTNNLVIGRFRKTDV